MLIAGFRGLRGAGRGPLREERIEGRLTAILAADVVGYSIDLGRYPRLTAALVSDAVLDAAFAWVCRRRRHWPDEKQRLKEALLSGRFRFGLLLRVTRADGSEADLWSAGDALMLKALTLVLAGVLPVSPRCTHIKGNGGAKAAVRQVSAALAVNQDFARLSVERVIGACFLNDLDRPAGSYRSKPSPLSQSATFIPGPRAAYGIRRARRMRALCQRRICRCRCRKRPQIRQRWLQHERTFCAVPAFALAGPH